METMKAFGALMLLTALAQAEECRVVRLESWNWAYAELPASVGKYFTSMEIHSSEGSECLLDSTYGFKPYLIWVNHGCRGTFTVCSDADQCSNELLESWSWAYARYTIQGAARILSMTMTEAQSPASICISGDTYDYLGVDAYVDDGCRARFRICYVPGNSTTVTCSSQNRNEQVCEIGCQIKSAVLHKTLSLDPCVRDFSFFIGDTTITTKRGCQAEFTIGF